MKVDLSPELEQLVQEKVKNGRYHSPSEVVSEALRLLEDRDKLADGCKQEIRDKISAGWESLRRGESIDGAEFFASLEREEAARQPKG